MAFPRRQIPTGAKQLREVLHGKVSYQVPAIKKGSEGQFYRNCQTYSAIDGDIRRRTFAGECVICGNSRHVITARYRTLKVCPRYDTESKTCWGD